MSDEVKHAHWITYGWSSKCSNCNYADIGTPNYCTNCGAKMDEPATSEIPHLSEWLLKLNALCKHCGNVTYGVKDSLNYCSNCGERLEYNETD